MSLRPRKTVSRWPARPRLPGSRGNGVPAMWPTPRRKVSPLTPSSTSDEMPTRAISIRPSTVPSAAGGGGAGPPGWKVSRRSVSLAGPGAARGALPAVQGALPAAASRARRARSRRRPSWYANQRASITAKATRPRQSSPTASSRRSSQSSRVLLRLRLAFRMYGIRDTWDTAMGSRAGSSYQDAGTWRLGARCPGSSQECTPCASARLECSARLGVPLGERTDRQRAAEGQQADGGEERQVAGRARQLAGVSGARVVGGAAGVGRGRAAARVVGGARRGRGAGARRRLGGSAARGGLALVDVGLRRRLAGGTRCRARVRMVEGGPVGVLGLRPAHVGGGRALRQRRQGGGQKEDQEDVKGVALHG